MGKDSFTGLAGPVTHGDIRISPDGKETLVLLPPAGLVNDPNFPVYLKKRGIQLLVQQGGKARAIISIPIKAVLDTISPDRPVFVAQIKNDAGDLQVIDHVIVQTN